MVEKHGVTISVEIDFNIEKRAEFKLSIFLKSMDIFSVAHVIKEIGLNKLKNALKSIKTNKKNRFEDTVKIGFRVHDDEAHIPCYGTYPIKYTKGDFDKEYSVELVIFKYLLECSISEVSRRYRKIMNRRNFDKQLGIHPDVARDVDRAEGY